MFEMEVDQALKAGWVGDANGNGNSTDRGDRGAASVIVTGEGDTDAAVTAWRSGPRSASSYRFKTLWFDDNLDGKLPKKGTSAFTYGLGKLNDIYDEGEPDGGQRRR